MYIYVQLICTNMLTLHGLLVSVLQRPMLSARRF